VRNGDRTIPQLAKELGVSPQSLRNWSNELDVEEDKAEGLTSAERDELERLRHENQPADPGRPGTNCENNGVGPAPMMVLPVDDPSPLVGVGGENVSLRRRDNWCACTQCGARKPSAPVK